MNDWLILLKLSALFLLLFVIAELLYRKAKVKAEYTRNIVHTGTGLLTLLFPVYFAHVWQVIIICATFLMILLLSMRYKLLPSINAVPRTTAGSILYPVIVCCVFDFYSVMSQRQTGFNPYLFFYLPVLIMAIADPVAALAGNYFGKQTGKKTLSGSAAFFVAAFIISGLLFYFFGKIAIGKLLYYSFIIALATTVAERCSNKGWDNFTIPSIAAALLYLIV